MVIATLTSEKEIKALEVFVTSATDPIYAIKHNIPPEVFGSFGSFFSRNPKDFREHLLDAMYGRIKGFETEGGEENVQWLAEGNFREPLEAIQTGLAKSQSFFEMWYGKYAHKSIANTVWVPMVATNVSQLFAKELAYDQLAFFIEQSTRFVKFNPEHVFHDPEVMQSRHAGIYMGALETLATAYHKITDGAINHYKRQIPLDQWLEMQDEKTRSSTEKAQNAKYEREMRGKALDVSRFLLPQATRTNIAWIVDARSHEFDIAVWKGHPLAEIRDAAGLIEDHAGQIAPSLLKYTEESEYYGDKLRGYGGYLRASVPEPFRKGVDIISYEKDALNKTIAHLLKRHNRGGTWRERYDEAQAIYFDDKIKILRRVTEKRGPHDEWIETDEDFDLIKITLEIRTDLGATRDWRRHQKWDRGEPLNTLDNGVHRPYMFDEMPAEVGRLFDQAMESAHDAEMQIRREFPYQAQYIIPMAANHAITMSSGLDQLQYMVWTRTTPAGNFSYHKDALNIAEAVTRVHPWLLGYERYPEGKPFRQVHDEAPLKNILRIDGWEVGIHQ